MLVWIPLWSIESEHGQDLCNGVCLAAKLNSFIHKFAMATFQLLLYYYLYFLFEQITKMCPMGQMNCCAMQIALDAI